MDVSEAFTQNWDGSLMSVGMITLHDYEGTPSVLDVYECRVCRCLTLHPKDHVREAH